MSVRKPQKPSLASIAKAAGVSPSAVSLVLSGRAGDVRLSDATSARVQAAASAQGYVRPPRKRGPPRLHIGFLEDILGMEVRGLGGSVLYPLLDALAARGWLASVDPRLPADEPGPVLRDAAAVLLPVNHGFDARVRALADLAVASGSQPILLGRFLPDVTAIQVDGDQEAGGSLAAQHLLDLGHRRIAMMEGDAADAHSRARIAGFSAACAARGITAENWGAGGFSTAGGHRLATSRLASGRTPTGIFCCNDRMALGTLLALRESGRAVPGEVSLVGFDDQDECTAVAPGLTSVRFDAAGIGARIAGLLDPGAAPRAERISLPARLIARGSSAPVPASTTAPARKTP